MYPRISEISQRSVNILLMSSTVRNVSWNVGFRNQPIGQWTYPMSNQYCQKHLLKCGVSKPTNRSENIPDVQYCWKGLLECGVLEPTDRSVNIPDIQYCRKRPKVLECGVSELTDFGQRTHLMSSTVGLNVSWNVGFRNWPIDQWTYLMSSTVGNVSWNVGFQKELIGQWTYTSCPVLTEMWHFIMCTY